MHSLKTQPSNIIFANLANKLLQSQQWQLLNKETNNQLLKNMKTNKIYQIITTFSYQAYTNCCTQLENQQSDMIDSSQFYGGIFLDLFRVGHECFLKERWLTTLKERIYTAKVRGTGGFSQQEIVNTFMPILRALSQKLIPSFYRIDSQKIVLDSNSNIRLRKAEKQSIDQQNEQNLNIHQQLAVVVLEASLFLNHEAAINLSKNQEKAVKFLLQRQFGYKVIGIVIILLNEGKKRLPINLEQIINSELANQWFVELKANIQKFREQNEMKKLENIEINNKVIYKMARRNQSRCEDETQDSPNQKLAKYRSGKRLTSCKNEESPNKPDLTETLLKPRKDRQRPNFN